MEVEGFCPSRYAVNGSKIYKVTGLNAALFEIYQVSGPILLITSAVVHSQMSFPVTSIAF